MSDSNEARIAALENELSELREQLTTVTKDLAEARVEALKGRLEDLEVQAHLGAMNVGDRIAPVVDQLRTLQSDLQGRTKGATSAMGDMFETLRDGVGQAARDLRRAAEDVRSRVSG